MADFLFVRIPKTASSSICQALYGTNPWPQHKTAEQLKRELGAEYDRLFKFSIVRNPYERFRSMCRFFKITPEEFIKEPKFKTQTDFLYIKNRLAVDYVGKFEDLDNSFKEICKRIGIETTLLPHIKPHLGDLPKMEDVIEIVNDYFTEDFKRFGYKIKL